MVEAVVINRKPKNVRVISVSRTKPKVVAAKKILRGQQGATDFQAIAPLNLDSNGDLKLLPFEFVQSANLATWNITHNLGKRYPNVVVVDQFGNYIEGDIQPIDENNLSISFAIPVMGAAYIS